MVSAPFMEKTSTPAVRRPVLEVSFGSDAGGGDSLLGGAASAVGGALGIGAAGGSDKWKQSVVAVAFEAGLAPSVDTLEVYLASGEQSPPVAVGDAGTLSLGYEDSAASIVFTGTIDSVRHSLRGVTCLTATNGGATLSRLRLNQSYEQQTAGDVVGELAGKGAVETDGIEDGVDFAFFVVDDRSNVYQHIAALARKSSHMAYFTPEGKLRFVPFVVGQATQTFTYGVDVLSLEVTEAAPNAGEVTTVGEGAAGSNGQEAWNWLVKNPSPVKGTAGEGAPARIFQDASLRSGDAAQTAADAIAQAANLMTLSGRLLVPGTAEAVVGGTVEIVAAPHESLNGLCLVRRVRHHYSKHEGFKTEIEFSKEGAGGGGGLGGALGGLL